MNRSHILIQKAIAWWRARKPCDWTEAQHLGNPTINCYTDWDRALARSASRVVALGKMTR